MSHDPSMIGGGDLGGHALSQRECNQSQYSDHEMTLENDQTLVPAELKDGKDAGDETESEKSKEE